MVCAVASRRLPSLRISNSPNGSMASEQPIVAGVAGRYATALFDLALEEKALDKVRADLDRFDQMVAGSADLNRLVRSPVFGADEQVRALDAGAEAGQDRRHLRQFHQARGRPSAACSRFRDIIRAFRAMVANHKGEVSASVTVAEPLSDAHLTALKSALNSVTGKDVDLRSRSIRPSSAASWSSWAAAWSIPRSAPNSIRSRPP